MPASRNRLWPSSLNILTLSTSTHQPTIIHIWISTAIMILTKKRKKVSTKRSANPGGLRCPSRDMTYHKLPAVKQSQYLETNQLVGREVSALIINKKWSRCVCVGEIEHIVLWNGGIALALCTVCMTAASFNFATSLSTECRSIKEGIHYSVHSIRWRKNYRCTYLRRCCTRWICEFGFFCQWLARPYYPSPMCWCHVPLNGNLVTYSIWANIAVCIHNVQ